MITGVGKRGLRFSFLALASAAVFAAAGGSSLAAGGNGIASDTPAAILSATYAAVTQSKSVHVAGVLRSGKQTITLDLELVKGRGGGGSMTVNGLGFKLISLGPRAYFKAGAAFWTHAGSAAAAAVLKNRWLETPATGTFKAFAQLTSVHDLFQALLRKPGKNLVVRGVSRVDGQSVIGVYDQKHGGTLYVATDGKPYPLEIDKPGADGGRISFSDFNRPASLTAPAGAIKLSQLLHQ